MRIVRDELKLVNLPVFFNMNFGHTSPMCVLPYGALATIDCDSKAFRIDEAGVL